MGGKGKGGEKGKGSRGREGKEGNGWGGAVSRIFISGPWQRSGLNYLISVQIRVVKIVNFL